VFFFSNRSMPGIRTILPRYSRRPGRRAACLYGYITTQDAATQDGAVFFADAGKIPHGAVPVFRAGPSGQTALTDFSAAACGCAVKSVSLRSLEARTIHGAASVIKTGDFFDMKCPARPSGGKAEIRGAALFAAHFKQSPRRSAQSGSDAMRSHRFSQ
jgi:hypothetical protein